MSIRKIIIACLATTVALLPPTMAAKRYADAGRERDAATRAYGSAVRDASEVLELRSRTQRIETRQRPQEHVLAQVNAALANAGVPAARLQGLRPDADVALPGSASGGSAAGLRRQSLTLSLQQIDLQEVGAFLTVWRDQQTLWTPTRIELTKSRGRAEDHHYDATIALSAVYLDAN